MGLAKAVAARFPSWGQDFSTLMVRAMFASIVATPCIDRCTHAGARLENCCCCALASTFRCCHTQWRREQRSLMVLSVMQIGVILINMLSGPSLFRAAIVALGESRRRGFQDADSRTLTK